MAPAVLQRGQDGLGVAAEEESRVTPGPRRDRHQLLRGRVPRGRERDAAAEGAAGLVLLGLRGGVARARRSARNPSRASRGTKRTWRIRTRVPSGSGRPPRREARTCSSPPTAPAARSRAWSRRRAGCVLPSTRPVRFASSAAKGRLASESADRCSAITRSTTAYRALGRDRPRTPAARAAAEASARPGKRNASAARQHSSACRPQQCGQIARRPHGRQAASVTWVAGMQLSMSQHGPSTRGTPVVGPATDRAASPRAKTRARQAATRRSHASWRPSSSQSGSRPKSGASTARWTKRLRVARGHGVDGHGVELGRVGRHGRLSTLLIGMA